MQAFLCPAEDRLGITLTAVCDDNLSLVSIKCFSARNKSELFARANAVAFCRFP